MTALLFQLFSIAGLINARDWPVMLVCVFALWASLLPLPLRYIYDNVSYAVDGPAQVRVNFSSALVPPSLCPVPLTASALSVFPSLRLSSALNLPLFYSSHPHFLSLDIVHLFFFF